MQAKRKEKLKNSLKANKIEAYLITNHENMRYISGFTGSSGLLLVTPEDFFLFTDFRYVEQAREETKNIEEIKVIKHESSAIKTIKEKLTEFDLNDLCFEKKHVTYEQYEKFKNELDFLTLIPHEGIVEDLRCEKDETELKNIKEACKIVDLAFSHVLSFIKPGISEKDVSLELEYYIKRNGAENIAFDIIVASGTRSSLPHGVATTKKLVEGEFLKLDFGAVYNGYCSDITRTVILGSGTDKQKEIYELVLKAQNKALNSIKPGMKASEADAFARDEINMAGYGDYFGHGLGHGLGLDVHEFPTISFNKSNNLNSGMVFTIEPGVYLPDYGGVRIEDTVMLTSEGCVSLTESTKELIILG